jgi:hypothetical protein
MMNPYLQFPPEKAEKKRTEMNEELAAQVNGQLARNASSKQMNVGLWIGNLLIRMGKKLTEREIDLKTSKEHA